MRDAEYVDPDMVCHALTLLAGVSRVKVSRKEEQSIWEHYARLQAAAMVDVFASEGYLALEEYHRGRVLPFYPACAWEPVRSSTFKYCVGDHNTHRRLGLRLGDFGGYTCDLHPQLKASGLPLHICDQCHETNLKVWTPVLATRYTERQSKSSESSTQ